MKEPCIRDNIAQIIFHAYSPNTKLIIRSDIAKLKKYMMIFYTVLPYPNDVC